MRKKALKKEIKRNSTIIDDMFTVLTGHMQKVATRFTSYDDQFKTLYNIIRSLEKADMETVNDLDVLEAKIKRLEQEVFGNDY